MRDHLQKYLMEFYKPLSYLLHWNSTKDYSKQYYKYHHLSISTSMLHSTFIADTHFMRAFSSYLLFRTNGCHKTHIFIFINIYFSWVMDIEYHII